MPLSLDKLRIILKKKNMIPTAFYVYKGSIIFIEILNIKYSNFFMLYIESSYDFDINHQSFGENETIYYIKSIDVSEFMSKNLGQDIKDIYSEIHFTPKLNLNDENLEKKLKGEYVHPIKVEDLKKDDGKNYIETYKQIDRLKESFNLINYKLCVIYNQYVFCVVENKIKCYIIENFEEEDAKYNSSYYITTNFKNFFEKLDTLDYEINQIKNKLERILDYIQKNQYKRISDLYSNKNDITLIYKEVTSKKEELISIRDKLKEKLDTAFIKEKEYEKEYEKLSRKGLEDGAIQAKGSIERSLSEIIKIREELTEKLNKINCKINDFQLTIDKIFYTNFIMMNNIRKNIDMLSDLIK